MSSPVPLRRSSPLEKDLHEQNLWGRLPEKGAERAEVFSEYISCPRSWAEGRPCLSPQKTHTCMSHTLPPTHTHTWAPQNDQHLDIFLTEGIDGSLCHLIEFKSAVPESYTCVLSTGPVLSLPQYQGEVRNLWGEEGEKRYLRSMCCLSPLISLSGSLVGPGEKEGGEHKIERKT